VLLAHASDQQLQLLPRKSDHPVWGSGPSGFPVSKSCCPTSGQCVSNGHLLRSSLHSQNAQEVLAILGGRASAAEPIVHTTLKKADKVGTSSGEVPMAQALVARSRNKASDDNLVDSDPGILNFIAAESEIVWRMSSRL
jgi:hypothetical protein